MNFSFRYFLVAVLGGCILSQTQAQIGNNNPTGVTGDYNGVITTAGSYDPFTGNASREIDDIVVAGAVGAYPLKWTRRMNTRAVTLPSRLGRGGGWSRSYQWELNIYHAAEPTPAPGPTPVDDERPDGVITYPDGRSAELVRFWEYDTVLAAQEGPFGTVDRFKQIVQNSDYELQMADGGVVKFHKPQFVPGCRVTAIVDPYGLTTTFEYEGTGVLRRIKEPGGANARYLELTHSSHNVRPGVTALLLDKVEAYDGRGNVTQWVHYHYEPKTFREETWLYLTRVEYDDGTEARYTYQESNRPKLNQWDSEGSNDGIIKTCEDVRFAGPMKNISYVLRPRTATNGAAWGEIWKECHIGGAFLSELERPSPTPGAPILRAERRADNARRWFRYGSTALMNDRSDYMDPPHWNHMGILHEPDGSDHCQFTDANNHMTDKKREPNFGATVRVTHPEVTFPPPEPPQNSFVDIEYTDPARPHYIRYRWDERGKKTEYIRFPNHMVERINYPTGGGYETFLYNEFGHITEHRMTGGGIEKFTYDDRGLKQTYTPPDTDSDPTPGDHPTRYFYYGGPSGPGETIEAPERPDLIDRLRRVIDPHGNSTWYYYNARGQMTHVTHQDGTTVRSEYNDDGTLQWKEDELGHRIRYFYDEYKRVTDTKRVVDDVEETVTSDYTPWPVNGVTLSPLSHTTASVYRVTTLHSTIDSGYDANYRRSWTKAAPGAPPTNFDYDPVGNLTSVEDPRHFLTTFGFDERNRQISITNVSLNETTRVKYDAASNKILETRPDGVFRSWDYDNMNRLWHAYDWRTNPAPTSNQTTTYSRDDAGNAQFIMDTKGAVYGFVFDKLNRKTATTYPATFPSPSPTETWQYDLAGNVVQHKNPTDQIQYFHYDNRNRQDHSWWSGGAATGPDIVTAYDSANRITSIVTKNGETPITTVGFGYDEANRKIWEDQTLARPGRPLISHRVKTLLDHDGRRTNLQITDPPLEGGTLSMSPEMSGSGSYSITYDYNARNQLWHINGDYGENWNFTYSYDDSGNMVSRQADYNGNSSSTNCPNNDYDALNRPRTWEQTGPNGFHMVSHHEYDDANREKSVWRDEDQNGERFAFEPTNQLAGVAYNATDVSAWPPPSGAERTVVYAYSLDKLHRSTVTETLAGHAPTATNYTPNPLNQYTTVGGMSYSYDTNFNLAHSGGFHGIYDAANHLVSASNSGALEAPNLTAAFVYDGLGRCVMRRVGEEETVFVYDEWKPIGEFDGWGNFQAWNVYGPGADEILLRSKDFYGYTIFLLDRHGNVAFLVDNDGNLLEKYTYDVFGRPTITDVGGEKLKSTWFSHNFLFQGREYIWQLGVYDYRNRFYLPATGQFLQTDPKGFDAGDMNLFRYCGDDPIDRSDPLGLDYLDVEYTSVSKPVSAPGQRDVSGWVFSGTMTWRSDNGTAQRSYSINSGGYKAADSKVKGPDTPTLPGKYSVDNLRENRGGLMSSDGYGFSFDVNPKFKQAQGRVQTLIRIHADGGEEGTHGCIGVCEPARNSREFVKRMQNYSKNHKDIEMRVRDRTGRTSEAGRTGEARNDDASRPSAARVDATHQSTGVPGLGAEAVNFAPGKP